METNKNASGLNANFFYYLPNVEQENVESINQQMHQILLENIDSFDSDHSELFISAVVNLNDKIDESTLASIIGNKEFLDVLLLKVSDESL